MSELKFRMQSDALEKRLEARESKERLLARGVLRGRVSRVIEWPGRGTTDATGAFSGSRDSARHSGEDGRARLENEVRSLGASPGAAAADGGPSAERHLEK